MDKTSLPTKSRLPAAEMEVLACLHNMGEVTAAEIREALQKHRRMAHGSVMTLLKRLETKGMVSRKKGPVGKAFIYFARQKRRQTFRGVVRDVVQRIFHGDGAALVASLFETQPPTPEELDKIQRMLDELRAKPSKRESKCTP
jgi:BlaI family transcriptional regulator, penicillinase repressor